MRIVIFVGSPIEDDEKEVNSFQFQIMFQINTFYLLGKNNLL